LKEITEAQYWQIYGLVTAKIAFDKQINSLYQAYGELVGKDNEDRFWDYSEPHELKNILNDFEHDNITVKWNKKK